MCWVWSRTECFINKQPWKTHLPLVIAFIYKSYHLHMLIQASKSCEAKQKKIVLTPAQFTMMVWNPHLCSTQPLQYIHFGTKKKSLSVKQRFCKSLHLVESSCVLHSFQFPLPDKQGRRTSSSSGVNTQIHSEIQGRRSGPISNWRKREKKQQKNKNQRVQRETAGNYLRTTVITGNHFPLWCLGAAGQSSGHLSRCCFSGAVYTTMFCFVDQTSDANSSERKAANSVSLKQGVRKIKGLKKH